MPANLLPRLFFIVCIIALSATFSACNHSEPISDNEAMSFAREMEKSIKQHNPAFVNDAIDKEELSDRISSKANIGLNFAMKRGIRDGIKNIHLGEQIANGENTYELVKHYVKDGHQHLLFRLYGAQGLNYHDCELTKHKGKTRIADMYVYLVGQNLSEIMARTINIYKEKNIDDATYTRGANQIKEAQMYANNGNYDAAAEAYRLIPQAFKGGKICRFLQVEISLGQNDTAAYSRQVQAYVADFPGTPDIYLIQIGANFKLSNYHAALQAINDLDHFIDKDPFLDYYRGLAYKQMEYRDSAAFCFKRLHASRPQMQEALVELIAGSLNMDKTAEASAYIAEYKKNKAYNQDLLHMLALSLPKYTAMFN